MKKITLLIAVILLLAQGVSAKVRTVVPSLILEESSIVVTIKNFNSKNKPFTAELITNGNTLVLESKLRSDKKRADIFFPDLVLDDVREIYGLLRLTGKGNIQETPVVIVNKTFVDASGPQGLQGPKGDKGDKGDTGSTGATGPQGPPGKNGKNGKNGLNGVDGKDGTGITNTAVVNGTLLVTLSNGSTQEAGSVPGLEDAKINSDGILLVKFTDGTVKALGKVVGEKGPQGATGPAGPQGPPGQGGSGTEGFRMGQIVQFHNPTEIRDALVAIIDDVVINRLNIGGEYKGDFFDQEDLNSDPILIYREIEGKNKTNLIIEVKDDIEESASKVDTLKIGAQVHNKDEFKSVLEVDSQKNVRIPSLAGGKKAGKYLTTDDEGNLILVDLPGFNSDDDEDDCKGNNGNDKPVGQGACNSNK